MAAKKHLGTLCLHDAQELAFWRYLDSSTVAIVTQTAVLHWKVTETRSKKMFQIEQSLQGRAITTYQVTDDLRWLLLGNIEGKMQLYCVETRVSYLIDGYSGGFLTMPSPRDTPLYDRVGGGYRGVNKAQILFVADKKPGAALQVDGGGRACRYVFRSRYLSS